MEIPKLTEATIRENTTDASFRRGKEYFEAGAVLSLKQHEHQVEADVRGGHFLPYAVQVEYDEAGITEATCTCPYHAGSWCKHIAAVLLACLHSSTQVVATPPVATYLEGLDRADLVDLVEHLAAFEPALLDVIERESARLRDGA